MRFTPPTPANIKAVRIGISNDSTETCSLSVWTHGGGLPANLLLKMSYVPTLTPSGWEWQTINLTSAVPCSLDFWIVTWIPPTGHTYIITDTVLNYLSRMAWKVIYTGWAESWGSKGDFRIRAIVSTEGTEEAIMPFQLALDNYPNPVTDKTIISYTLPEETKVKLEIYDITGRSIKNACK